MEALDLLFFLFFLFFGGGLREEEEDGESEFFFFFLKKLSLPTRVPRVRSPSGFKTGQNSLVLYAETSSTVLGDNAEKKRAKKKKTKKTNNE